MVQYQYKLRERFAISQKRNALFILGHQVVPIINTLDGKH